MQRFYESLLRLSLKGMNYGNGGDYQSSGELNVLQYMKGKLQPDTQVIAFDVGANIGNYSKALADTFESNLMIHAFEPSLKTFDRLLTNTSCIKNIFRNNFGFSDIENTSVLYFNKDASGLASIYQRQHLSISLDRSEEIKLTTIDAYCHGNNIEKIHFLKLDIEGHELSALKGAQRMINERKIDFIQFEFGGTNIDSRTYFRDFFYLLKDNYRLYRVLRDGLWEIPHYSIPREIFGSINYLAEMK